MRPLTDSTAAWQVALAVRNGAAGRTVVMEANPVFDAIGLKHTDRNADYSARDFTNRSPAMTATTTQLMRELDHRTSDGIDVRLLWCERDGRVLVAVNDAKTGESFTVEVREGESAKNVFDHPFAYADRRVPAPALPAAA
jgi:hypothetical protein